MKNNNPKPCPGISVNNPKYKPAIIIVNPKINLTRPAGAGEVKFPFVVAFAQFVILISMCF